MKRGLATLLRLRRAERDAKALALAAARTQLDECEGRRDATAARALAARAALRAAGESGRAGGWWHPASFGAVALAEQVEREEAAASAARNACSAAQEDAFAAERSLRALERLAERIAERERRSRARAEQRRLEDVANGVRRATLALALVAGALAASGLARAQEASPAVIPLLADLQARHAELDRRERTLADREAHARELEKVAGARLAQAEEIAAQVEQRIEAWHKEQDDKPIGRLARIYAGMAPAKAGPLLERLDLDLATRIVAKMKPQESAELLPFLSPERALAMSWLVAHPLALRTDGDPSAAEPKP